MGVDTGVEVAIIGSRLASTEVPIERSSCVHDDSDATRSWEALTRSQPGVLADPVRKARQPATRKRRAEETLFRRS
ncbi:hypothetical protein CKO41_03270 [Thiococcus pfennigii]|nr:hypothetical protein [Thiococcus pfennigii]